MIPAAFDYQKAKTVEEAVEALATAESKILAGGQSLLPVMKLRLGQPSKLVDIAGIAELHGIHEEDGEIVIGAATTHAEITRDKLIAEKLPFFSTGAGTIGDRQVRNHGTIGGSLAHADPAADWPALVLAADAGIEVRGRGKRRRIKSTDFFKGLFTTDLQDNEIITAVRIPIPPEGTSTAYEKFSQPASRFAIVGCAVMRFKDGRTNIAFTGVSGTPFRDQGAERAVSAKPLNDQTISAAMVAALKDVQLLNDHYASAEYREHLARVYLKRALQAVS
jgi:carbon-monoxide dehydrogenase medium subunit